MISTFLVGNGFFELLVVPADLQGQTFADAGYVPTEGANVCGVDADAAHPAEVRVGTNLVDDANRSIVEEIRVYADVDVATAAYEAHRVALDCAGGPSTDVTADVGGDAAAESTVAEDEGRGGVRITVLVGDALVQVEVITPDGAEGTLVDREVAAFAVGKVLAALEAG